MGQWRLVILLGTTEKPLSPTLLSHFSFSWHHYQRQDCSGRWSDVVPGSLAVLGHSGRGLHLELALAVDQGTKCITSLLANASDIVVQALLTGLAEPSSLCLETHFGFSCDFNTILIIWYGFWVQLGFWGFFWQRKGTPTNPFPQPQSLVQQSFDPCTSLLSPD